MRPVPLRNALHLAFLAAIPLTWAAAAGAEEAKGAAASSEKKTSGAEITKAAPKAPVKDTSKPTNLYTMSTQNIEFERNPDGNKFGFRSIIQLAPNEANLFQIEIPLLFYNAKTEKAGPGDLRVRYFNVAYKDYSKLFGAFGVSVDLFAPTGRFDNGLGSGSWIVSPGVIFGLMFSSRFTMFPVLSYLLTTEPDTNLIPDAQKKTSHGLSVQAIGSVVVTPRFFVLVTPIFAVGDLTNGSTASFSLEVAPTYAIVPSKIQLGVFFRGNFNSHVYTGRVAVDFFL